MIVKRGQRVEVTIEVIVPVDCTEEQLADWIYFEANYTGFLNKETTRVLGLYELIPIECSYSIQTAEPDIDDLKVLDDEQN